MAEKNIQMNVKTEQGYDKLYPKTKSDLVNFNNSGSNLQSDNVEKALYEVSKNIGVLNTLKGVKNSLVSAINEIHDKFLKKESIVDNLSSNNSNAPLSANMGKKLNDSVKSFGISCTTGKYVSEWVLSQQDYKTIGNGLSAVDNEYYHTEELASKIRIKQSGSYLIIGHIYCKHNNRNVTPSVWSRFELGSGAKLTEAHLLGIEGGFSMVTYMDIQANDTIDLSLSCNSPNVTAYAKSNTLTVIKLR